MNINNIEKLLKKSNNRLKIIYNNKIMDNLNEYQICELIVKYLNDDEKITILYDENFLKEYNMLYPVYIVKIILNLSDINKEKILTDNKLITQNLYLKIVHIINLVESLNSDESKIKIFRIYNFKDSWFYLFVKCLSDTSKIKLLLESSSFDKIQIINTLILFQNIEFLIDFFNNNKDFLQKNNIYPCEVISNLTDTHQQQIVSLLDTIELTEIEKKEIFATLNNKVKKSIDTTNLSIEYKKALSLKNIDYVSKYSDKAEMYANQIIIDFNRNLEDYRGLDHILILEPEIYTEEERKKSLQLCRICPNLKIVNPSIHDISSCTTQEYIEAEDWISNVLNFLKQDFSDAQKLALIDYVIGKRISYSPDFNTEISNIRNYRSVWKIICSGYGICNGITAIEKYLLDRIGIESEFICSQKHGFLKLINIELPFLNGEIKKGNTIMDPTWNLASHRFGGKPECFCIDYETARFVDINSDGTDSLCHKNDEELNDATLSLDDASLRNLFRSIGLTDEKGIFPIYYLESLSTEIHNKFSNNLLKDICHQFTLLSKYYPYFATCPNSSMRVIKDILFDSDTLEFNKCVINRVYNKKDKTKKPILYVYIDSDEFGKLFFYATSNSEQSIFMLLDQNDFTSTFECYEEDLKKNNGIRPWETSEPDKTIKNLSTPSDNIVAMGGECR